jgi:hypothetical protein
MARIWCQACQCWTRDKWKLTLVGLSTADACPAWEGRSIEVTWNGTRWEGTGCDNQPTWLQCANRPDWGCMWTAMVMGVVQVDGWECKCVLDAQQGAVGDMDCEQGGHLVGIACRCVGDNSRIDVAPA